MKEDLDIYIKRSKLVERAEVYRDTIAISKAPDGENYGQILIAQAADTLLTMSGVNASFVICERDDDKIGISARSLGDVNVQIIMERMNGGGHLTRSEEHTSELQSRGHLVCRLLLEQKKTIILCLA